MSELSSAEKGQATSHRRASSPTLSDNSCLSTATSSRETSVERQKRAQIPRMATTMAGERSTTPRSYLYQELDSSYMTLVIIICFLISGLIDSVSFNSWNCFVNMQTGNTVFAALGLRGQPVASHNQQYYKSLTAIGAFCLGALFFSALHRYPTGLSLPPSSRRRLILILSFTVQAIFITIAALLVSLDLVSNQPFLSGFFSSGSHAIPATMTNYLDLCPVALLSFQAAGQVTLSRLLSVADLPTTVLSTVYLNLISDLYSIRDSWRKSSSMREFILVHQKRQEQRFACIIALFLGAIIGGEMYKSPAGMAGALWVAAGMKYGVAVGWFFWKKEDDESASLEDLPR